MQIRRNIRWVEANWPAPARALTTTRAFDRGNGSGFNAVGCGPGHPQPQGVTATIAHNNPSLYPPIPAEQTVLGLQVAMAQRDSNTGRAADGAAAMPNTAVDGRGQLRLATTGPSGRLQWLRQVHGSHCIRASGAGCAEIPEADAAWTDEVDLGLVVLTADCVPIVVTDRAGSRIGVAHGGWRGLIAGVTDRLIGAMGATPPRLAWIGPAIGRDAYEVGVDVFDALRTNFGRTLADEVCGPGRRLGKWQLDLFGLAERLLRSAGVSAVYGSRLCTFSDSRFYSHRCNGTSGRMATVAWLPERIRTRRSH